MSDSVLELQENPGITDLRDVIAHTWLAINPEIKKVINVPLDNVEATVKNITFDGLDPIDGKPESLDQLDYTNDSSLEQSVTFKRTVETGSKVGLSVTSGFTYKHEISGKISLEKLFDIGEKHNIDISLSSTATVEDTFNQTWSWDFPIKVAPRTRIVATAILKTESKEPKFTADIEIVAKDKKNSGDSSYITVWAEVLTDKGKEKFGWSLNQSVFGAAAPAGFSEVPGDWNRIIYHCKGKIKGTQGKKVTIVVKEYSVDTGELTGLSVYTGNGGSDVFGPVDMMAGGKPLRVKDESDQAQSASQ